MHVINLSLKQQLGTQDAVYQFWCTVNYCESQKLNSTEQHHYVSITIIISKHVHEM